MDHAVFQPTAERPGRSSAGDFGDQLALRIGQTVLEAARDESDGAAVGRMEHWLFHAR